MPSDNTDTRRFSRQSFSAVRYQAHGRRRPCTDRKNACPQPLHVCALHRQFRSVRSGLRGQLFFWFNGRRNKQIADKLSIAETTVKNHISNILFKLGANDRAHAVTIFALQRGIIELDLRQR